MFVTSGSLSALPGIRHAFFTREGGVSEGLYASLNAGLGSADAPERVRENRRRMAETLGVAPDALISCYQIHSDQVVIAERPHDGGERPKADAVVTKVPGIACGVASADCGPVLFADAEAGVVGAAHAGWKGAIGGILEATIAAMEKLGADRSRIHTAIGPLIRQPSYEVSQAFVDQFRAADEAYGRFFAAGKPGTPSSICQASSLTVSRPQASAASMISVSTPIRTRRGSSRSAGPPIGRSLTTGATSPVLHSRADPYRLAARRSAGTVTLSSHPVDGANPYRAAALWHLSPVAKRAPPLPPRETFQCRENPGSRSFPAIPTGRLPKRSVPI